MSTTDEQRLREALERRRSREFYEAFDEYTANCGHQPTAYDMWLIARGVMYTDGHYVIQAQQTVATMPAAPADAQPLSDETLDEIAALAAHWKRHRDNGHTPAGIRGALHMVIEGTAATSQPDGGPRDALTFARDMFLCCANFAALANKIDDAIARQAAAPSSTAEFYELYERSVL